MDTSGKEYWWLNFAVLVAKVALVLGEKGFEPVDYEVHQGCGLERQRSLQLGLKDSGIGFR